MTETTVSVDQALVLPEQCAEHKQRSCVPCSLAYWKQEYSDLRTRIGTLLVEWETSGRPPLAYHASLIRQALG